MINSNQSEQKHRSNSWSTNEHLKRKRDKEKTEIKTEVDAFRKSKRIVRSPIKINTESADQEKNEKMEDLKTLMGTMIEKMEVGFKDNKTEIQKLREEIKEKEEQWQKERSVLQQGINTLEKKINQLEERLEIKERKERKQNIIIKGLKMEKESLAENIENFITKELRVECEIREAYKIGVNKDIIVAKTQTWEEKIQIMKAKNKLGERKIYIENDMTKGELETQKKIRQLAFEEKQKGNRVKVGYKKISINNIQYEWDKIKTLERLPAPKN